MPLPEEQRALVETALHKRFFDLVPKVETENRKNWKEEQHDIDRLSRALIAYSMVALAQIDDATAASTITDGENDGGIDGFFFDKVRNRLLIVQSKFKNATVSQDENNKALTGVRRLLSLDFGQFNDAMQNRADEVEEAINTPGIKVVLVLVCLGDAVNRHVEQDLEAVKKEKDLDSTFEWNWYGRQDICDWLAKEQAPDSADFTVTLEKWGEATQPYKAIYGQIDASELSELVVAHGNALFQRNIRYYLGSVDVNKAIVQSVRQQPDDFFYLNNGITIVAEEVKHAAGIGKRRFRLKNASVVNGAQTVGAIADAALSHAISSDVKLLVTIIEVGTNTDLSKRITQARNKQNTLRGIEFAALDPQQERLRREIAACGLKYFYRPSIETADRSENIITLEEAAIALACQLHTIKASRVASGHGGSRAKLDNAVTYVVAAKNELGRLWDQSDPIYKRLFPVNLTGIRLCRAVRVYRLLDQILSDSERAESSLARKMFFKHGRYFIIAFVAHQLPDVITRAEIGLSDGDKNALSLQANSVSEQIFETSQSAGSTKGYLATFRNQTEAQALADMVLSRLS